MAYTAMSCGVASQSRMVSSLTWPQFKPRMRGTSTMANHSLRYGSRSAGSHRRARSAGTVRVRAVSGILAAALALGGGIAATVLAQPGHSGAHPAHVTARQTHSHQHRGGYT